MAQAPRDENYIPTLIAADSSDLETPVIVTGRELTSAQPLDVALVDADGNQIGGAAPDNSKDGIATLTDTNNTEIIAAQGAGSRLYISSIAITNTSSTAVRVDIKDGTTVKLSFYVAAAGGGASHSMPTPLRLTANTALNAAMSASVTDVRVSAQGYKLDQ